MTVSAHDRLRARNDLAWAISVGGIGIVAFAALLMFTWYFAATLFLIFAGMLLGVALNAMTNMLGRVVRLPHSLRLTIVCVVLTGLLSGVVFLGGASIAQQAAVLSNTIKSQLVGVKAFLERNGIDTSYFDLGNPRRISGFVDNGNASCCDDAQSSKRRCHRLERRRDRQPDPEIASGHGERGRKFLYCPVSRADVRGAAERLPKGLLFMAPARHRARATVIIDRIGETLERWLIAQIITMAAVFVVTWIGLSLIGIQSSFILGIQAGLLTFIPTVGALVAGLIVVLASLASGWVAAASAFALFLGIHALESYILTPILQRQALEIPPATLFAFQILLGVVFGIWGLALALPLMAIAKVMIDHFKANEASADALAA